MKPDAHNELQCRAEYILNHYFTGENDSFDSRVQEWLFGESLTDTKNEALKGIWNMQVKYAAPDDYAYRSLDALRERLGFVKIKKHGAAKTFLRIAGGALLFALISYGALMLVQRESRDDLLNEITTNISYTTVEVPGIARKHIVLPDGSHVWIGNYSRITYPDNFDLNRRVELSGIAYFTVSGEYNIPFYVMGNNLCVKVLGTEFEMNSPEMRGMARVTLAKGVVEVRPGKKGKPVLMKPNEKLSYHSVEGRVSVEEVNENEIAPWRNIKLLFDNTPLGEALQDISVYYGITMAIDGGIPLKSRITGRFSDDETLEEVLFVIGKTTGMFEYEIEGEHVKLIGALTPSICADDDQK